MDQIIMWTLAGMTGGAVGGILSTYIVLAIAGFYKNKENLKSTKWYQEYQ